MAANFNINKIILAGRLTADVELKSTPNGKSVSNFSIAYNKYNSTTKKTDVKFFNCVAWGKTAEFISKYFRKGSSICIVGELDTRNFTDAHGTKRTQTEIVASEVLFVESMNSNSGNDIGTNGNGYETIGANEDLPF